MTKHFIGIESKILLKKSGFSVSFHARTEIAENFPS
tara:strand:+ start:3415 stop:3522 length:108 start_codon:yes stop_codon:yes gene_type:complete